MAFSASRFSVMAVSYTHLDVYKRQPEDRARQAFPGARRKPRSPRHRVAPLWERWWQSTSLHFAMCHGRIAIFHELLEAFHGFAMFHSLGFRAHFRKTDPSLPLSAASAAFAPRSTARGATACALALPPLLRQCQQPPLRWPVRLRLLLAPCLLYTSRCV